jgi:acyl-CoA reductase-like NAD-dependent aldehyde dehydrogenase
MAATIDIRSPYSGDVVGQVEQADAETVATAIAAKRELVRDRDKWLPGHERIAILKRAGGLVAARRDELAALIAAEGGKPLTDALIEVDRAANGLELCAEEIGHLAGEEIPMGATAASAGRVAFTSQEPIGVVVSVSAFNHPLNLIVHQTAPALAAGCPVLVKPAEPTPLSALALGDIYTEAGLPPGWCSILPMDNQVCETAVTSPDIGFFSFIGSARVGWMLRSKLAPGVRCALEHGGAAPLLVDASADLDKAVPAILKGGYYHAGQVCVSVQRVFADASIAAELADGLTAGAEALVVGDPGEAATEVGPLIRQGEVDRVGEWVDEAVGAGARLATGGQALDNQCYTPTLLVDPPDNTQVMASEIFGPVVNVVTVDGIDDGIARANSVPWAFQAAVFAQDIDRAMRATQRLDATAVMVNDHTAFRVDWMPFGGRGPSGLGMGGMGPTVHEMTRPKMTVIKL